MLRFLVCALCSLWLSLSGFAAPIKDYAGLKDPVLFTRMPNYYLPYKNSVQDMEFDRFEFRVKEGNRIQRVPVEGHMTYYRYEFDPTGGTKPSPLQVIRNYQQAAAALGGKVLNEEINLTTIVIEKQGKETWVEVMPLNSGYAVRIVERQAMKQDVVANADAFKTGLATNGHVEVPGIFFDTGKSEVKPESEPALQEVAKLLQADPTLKVWVVGHTDNTGSEEGNVALSAARAAAVMKVLTTKMAVSATRLSAHGAGPYSPVAPNETEEGRGKNRRVELVKKP